MVKKLSSLTRIMHWVSLPMCKVEISVKFPKYLVLLKDQEQLGKLLKKKRLELKLTQEKMAERLGVARNTYHGWETLKRRVYHIRHKDEVMRFLGFQDKE